MTGPTTTICDEVKNTKNWNEDGIPAVDCAPTPACPAPHVWHRMSGTAYGTVALYTSSEASAQGRLAVGQNNDIIETDVKSRENPT